MLTFLELRSTSGCLFGFLGGDICRCGCFFVMCVLTVYEVNKLPALDILLAMVFIEYYVKQFKGLSCCVPLGQHVHPFGLLRAFFSFLH